MAKRKKIKKKKTRIKRKNRKKKKSKKKQSLKKKRIISKKKSKENRDAEGNLVFKVSNKWSNQAYVNKNQYEKKYKLSIKNNEDFWAKEGKRINWIKPYKKIKDVKFSKDEVSIKWYYDGTLNASANCVDRHLDKKSNKTAIIWVGDDPSDSKKITYKELHKNVCKAANGLKSIGVEKGDRVTIYLTMIPELAYVMLACARIGAVHSIIFGGFSPDSIATRINDCESDYVITADEGVRGGKIIPLKKIADEAMMQCPNVKKCVVVKRTGNSVNWDDERDVSYEEITKNVSDKCIPEEMNAEDPLFILYTSGSTGKPKGVLHTTGGYMVYASMTHQYIFDYKPKDIYFCSADIGWVTGHSYIIYGPLSNGATTVMFEGIPTYPDYSRWWQIIDKYKELGQQLDSMRSTFLPIELVRGIKKDVKNIKRVDVEKPHDDDPTGNSKTKQTVFWHESGSLFTECYDWSEKITKEKGWTDNFSVGVALMEYDEWLNYKAYN